MHPMQEDQVHAFLNKAGLDKSMLDSLITRDLVIETEYKGHRFYIRRFPNISASGNINYPERPKACNE